MNTTANEPTLLEIDDLAKRYAGLRGLLAERVSDLEAELAAVQRRKIDGIKRAAAEAGDVQALLRAAIERSPQLFVKPRTFSLHGVTVGFQKGKGRLDWDDDTKVVSLIKKHLPEQAEVLILTEETPSADALKNLDGRDLARIGVRVEGTADQVIVKTSDTAVDKLVKKILNEGARETEDAATEGKGGAS